jgi:hypothetical protein
MPKTAEAPPAAACRRCGRRHRTWRAFALCVWPRAIWVYGDGRWASYSGCPHLGPRGREYAVTVELHPTRAGCERAKEMIDRGHCGNCCRKDHRVIDLAREIEEG